MQRINRKVEYALIALQYMRSKPPGQKTTVKEISSTIGCPFELTAKVLQTLANRGLVGVEHGVHGGYTLVRDLHDISLYELLNILVGPLQIARCLLNDETDDENNDNHDRHDSEKTSSTASHLSAAGSASAEQQQRCEIQDQCNVLQPIRNLNNKLNEFYKNLSLGTLLTQAQLSHIPLAMDHEEGPPN